MTGKDIIGPLPTIRFGSWPHTTRQVYSPPRDTTDLRARACSDHHPACDCREARFHEDTTEYQMMRKAFLATAQRILAGHRTFDYGSGPPWHDNIGAAEWIRYMNGDGPLACQCTGCQIIRGAHEHLDCDENGIVR
jgi:hypothetical protein